MFRTDGSKERGGNAGVKRPRRRRIDGDAHDSSPTPTSKRAKCSSAFRWTGQFRPELARSLIEAHARLGARVWDPFAGSGTVLFACAASDTVAHRVGSDVNPAAVAMARLVECATWDAGRLDAACQEVSRWVSQVETARCPEGDDVRYNADGDCDDPGTQRHDESSAYGTSDQDARLIADAVLYRAEGPDGRRATAAVDAWRHIGAFIESMTQARRQRERIAATARLGDARRQPLIATGSVDLILTSPPYINVINYHEQYRRLTERLGWRVVPDVAASEIGSNRKHRSNRFLTVIQYCLDMHAALEEMARACAPGGRAVLVVGRESNVCRVRIPNSRLIERLATEAGRWRQTAPAESRSFVNRFGKTIVEDILSLEPPYVADASDVPSDGGSSEGAVTPVSIAVDALREALSAQRDAMPPASIALIEAAINGASSVVPSPLLDPCAVLCKRGSRQTTSALCARPDTCADVATGGRTWGDKKSPSIHKPTGLRSSDS
jgi:SAM-dependent methyltransferase